ncbi:hypothetical protein tb265_39310 [Gemmatimonadetes bacterium T265]|nr:hypothetical protein tb265_39310 [Gemmatimonadetes bacterium T265]
MSAADLPLVVRGLLACVAIAGLGFAAGCGIVLAETLQHRWRMWRLRRRVMRRIHATPYRTPRYTDSVHRGA